MIHKNVMTVLIALFLMLAVTMPAFAADGTTIDNITEVVVESTPTPVPTLESMTHAKILSNGMMFPNYKVKDNNPVNDVPDYSKFGYAKFYNRAGGSALDQKLWLKNNENKSIPALDGTYLPDKTVIDGQNPDYKIVEFLPDGESDIIKLDAGEWTAYLQNGNGGQMETQIFKVGNGEITRVTFLGHAVSTRGLPGDATIDADFGCKDIDVQWMKMVKTGQHWIEPREERVCEQVTVTDVAAHNEYRYWISSHHGGYWSSWSDNHPYGNHETRYVSAVTHTETRCHTEYHHGYWQNEYGIEFFIEIDGANINVNNPNREPVDIRFNFDVNYWVDKKPWDSVATPDQIVQKSKKYYGSLSDIGSGKTTYHGVLYPDVDNAVTVLDFNEFGTQYYPYISNEVVSSTTWTR